MMIYRQATLASRDVARESAKLARAANARANAEEHFRASIVAARAAGLTARQIGESVGLTHTRVLQIEREEHEREADRG